MLDKIISGGRTGAEQAAWRAAATFGVPSAGWMPGGLLTVAAELPPDSAVHQTEMNVRAADATLWFGTTTTLGALETVGACHRFAKPCMLVYPGASFEPWHVASWIAETRIATLNVTGNR